MKISASIFATNDRLMAYVSQLKLAKVDYLHLDFFQNGTNKFRLEDINALDYLQIPYDVHLIYESVTRENIEILNNSSAEILSLQWENLTDAEKTLERMERFKGDIGFAVMPNTDLKQLYGFFPRLDHILVMCSEPGISGAKFMENSYDFISSIKKKSPDIKIYADGGIDNIRCRKVLELGVSLVVSGTYLFDNRNDMRYAVTMLKHPNRNFIQEV